MSRYTTEFRFLLANPEWTDERLGLSDYPIFSESYRDTLNNQIKRHFYFDEIGFETPARFAQRLGAKLNLIMPYYNQVYNSALVEIQPFLTVDLQNNTADVLKSILAIVDKTTDNKTDTFDGTVKHTGTDTTYKKGTETGQAGGEDVTKDGGKDTTTKDTDTTVTTNDLDVTSDTPEGFLDTDKIGSNTYASSANKHQGTEKTSGSETTTSAYGKTVTQDYGRKDTTTYDTQTPTEYNSQTKTDNVDVIQDIIDYIRNQEQNDNRNIVFNSKGYQGRTMSEMLNEWRTTFLNIDKMVLNELEELFLVVLD